MFLSWFVLRRNTNEINTLQKLKVKNFGENLNLKKAKNIFLYVIIHLKYIKENKKKFCK